MLYYPNYIIEGVAYSRQSIGAHLWRSDSSRNGNCWTTYMTRKAYTDRGARRVESEIKPATPPAEDESSGDEGIDDVRSEDIQDEKEPLDPPQQSEEEE